MTQPDYSVATEFADFRTDIHSELAVILETTRKQTTLIRTKKGLTIEILTIKAILMKLRILLIFMIFNFSTSLFSQETTKPLTDTEIMRNVSSMDIEGKEYENVTVTLKSISPDYFFYDIFRVKVTIVDMEGNTVWKKTLKNVFLYVFSDGQIQVGKPNFDRILIKKNYSGAFTGKIREKEGVY